MATIPPGIALDAAMLDRLSELLQLLRGVERRLVATLDEMKNAPVSAEYARARLRETREIIDGLLKIEGGAVTGAWAEWAMAHIPATYASGAGMAVRDLVLQGVAPVIGDPRIHAAAIDALITHHVRNAAEIVVQLHANTARAARAVMQQAGFRAEIATGIISGEARRTTSRRLERALRESLRESGIDPSEVTQIQLGQRTIRIETWAEMHARTDTARVVSAGTRSMVAANGIDHIQLSRHVHDPCICTPFEGRIYRLFEDRGDMRFPHVSVMPNGGVPLHPNCVHREAPAVVDYLEESGEIAGRMSIPAGFRGLSERELARLVRQNREGLSRYSRSKTALLPETFQLAEAE